MVSYVECGFTVYKAYHVNEQIRLQTDLTQTSYDWWGALCELVRDGWEIVHVIL